MVPSNDAFSNSIATVILKGTLWSILIDSDSTTMLGGRIPINSTIVDGIKKRRDSNSSTECKCCIAGNSTVGKQKTAGTVDATTLIEGLVVRNCAACDFENAIIVNPTTSTGCYIAINRTITK
jgi:hypothetical protein